MAMKAVVYTKYGPPEVLKIKNIKKPIPNNNQVLIKVYACTVNRTDCGLRGANYFVSRFFTGLTKPKRTVTGSEFAGKIVDVGKDVKNFKVGDKVFGFDDVQAGAHAEYITVHAKGPMSTMPEGYDYHEVAPAGEGATYALSDIRAADLSKGQKVLVYGASGAIGSAAVQILKYQGVRVTAVCGTKNVNLIKSLGADKVIDYQTDDFTQIKERFDLIFDAVGKSSYGECKHLLSKNGKYCSTELGAWVQNPLLAIWFAVTRSNKVIFPIPQINKEKIEYIKQMMEAGAFRPVIDKTYQLAKIVEAAKYVETGQKTGNVVIRNA